MTDDVTDEWTDDATDEWSEVARTSHASHASRMLQALPAARVSPALHMLRMRHALHTLRMLHAAHRSACSRWTVKPAWRSKRRESAASGRDGPRLGRAGGGVGVILAAAGVRAHDERAAEGGGGQNSAGGHGACVEPTAGRGGAESLEDWTRGGV